MKEIWKDIVDYQGYQVSNLGRVRTFNKQTFNKRHGIRKWKNRILKYKGETYKTGYKVDLWKDGKNKTFLVARLVAFTFFEKDINDLSLTVNHIDGNRFNNNINNLELISIADNIRHAFNTGLMSKCLKVRVINKETKEEKTFVSMQSASFYMNKNHGYIYNKRNKNIFENELYKWEFI